MSRILERWRPETKKEANIFHRVLNTPAAMAMVRAHARSVKIQGEIKQNTDEHRGIDLPLFAADFIISITLLIT